jgi:hypothetical protein
MPLREFIYADLEKIRSLMGQLSEGVPEESKKTETRTRQTTAGIKSIVSTSGDVKGETQISRSLADSIFSDLEDILETEGWLTDISEQLINDLELETLPQIYPPGSMIRITAPGQLFDARYVARALSGLAATAEGMRMLPGQPGTSLGSPLNKKHPGQSPKKSQRAGDEGTLEADIREFDSSTLGGITADNLKSIVKISRGMLSAGVHLMMTPRENAITISTRLQEGGQYLESDAEILFSRYGISKQQWTLVGTVGAYAMPATSTDDDLFADGFTQDDRVNRAMFADYVSRFMQLMGHQGLIDLPQFPGFSVVPLAVYRLISRNSSPELAPGAIV